MLRYVVAMLIVTGIGCTSGAFASVTLFQKKAKNESESLKSLDDAFSLKSVAGAGDPNAVEAAFSAFMGKGLLGGMARSPRPTTGPQVRAADTEKPPTQTTLLQVRAFPLSGPTENLEPEVLDFRYSPERWQVCTGLPDDPHKSIVGSDGGLYYDYGGGQYYGFQTRIGAFVETTGTGSAVEQRLFNARTPIVITERRIGNITLLQQAWARAPESKQIDRWSARRADYLWLKMKNTGAATQTAGLGVNIHSKDRLTLSDDKTRLVLKDNPGKTFCVISPACASIESQPASDLRLFFEEQTLAAGAGFDVLLTFYRGDEADVETSATQAPSELDRAVAYWKNVDLPYDRITVPDEGVQDLLDSCTRNIYQARELRNGQPAFQVGPTCYRGTWAADGPFILEAVTYLGRSDETRAGLGLQVEKDEGPQGVSFSKKCGLRLWMIWRHGQLTGDRQWLERMWPRVASNVRKIIEYRRSTMDDPAQANYGLMPIGFGDGGLGGKHREYTNVYWTLAGLKAAIEMAVQLDKPVAAEWQEELKDYWQFFDRARNRDKLTDSFGNVYVPVTMKGEQPQLPQRGAWAFLQSIFPGRIFDPGDELMLGTMAMLDAVQKEGLIYGTGWLPDGIWNYAASFYGHAHLWLGHGRKTAATLYAFGNHACPLLCWREEHNVKGDRYHDCGDMPHNWASAEFIRMVRHMLILERGSQLHLFEGLPRSWTKAGNKTQLTQIPTSFGDMDLTLTIADDGKTATIQVNPPKRKPPERIVIHTEHFAQIPKTIIMDKRKLSEADLLRIPTEGSFTLKIEFE